MMDFTQNGHDALAYFERNRISSIGSLGFESAVGSFGLRSASVESIAFKDVEEG